MRSADIFTAHFEFPCHLLINRSEIAVLKLRNCKRIYIPTPIYGEVF